MLFHISMLQIIILIALVWSVATIGFLATLGWIFGIIVVLCLLGNFLPT